MSRKEKSDVEKLVDGTRKTIRTIDNGITIARVIGGITSIVYTAYSERKLAKIEASLEAFAKDFSFIAYGRSLVNLDGVERENFHKKFRFLLSISGCRGVVDGDFGKFDIDAIRGAGVRNYEGINRKGISMYGKKFADLSMDQVHEVWREMEKERIEIERKATLVLYAFLGVAGLLYVIFYVL